MSNNLLITMGCSNTEGVGCYGHADPEFMERMKKLLVSNLNHPGTPAQKIFSYEVAER